jgi:putative transposase
MASVAELGPVVGVVGACEALGVARASYYRHARRRHPSAAALPPPSPRDEGAAGERSELSGPGPTGVGTAPAPGVPTTSAPTTPTRVHPRALSGAARTTVLEVLHSPRFQDAAPAAVYATLLDEQVYLASERVLSLPKDVPTAGGRGRDPIAPRSPRPSDLPEAGVAGHRRTRSGAGTSPSCSDRPSGPTSTCTSSSTSTAATSSAGWSPTVSRPSWPNA